MIIPFVNIVKFHFLAQFPVDPFPHLGFSSLLLVLLSNFKDFVKNSMKNSFLSDELKIFRYSIIQECEIMSYDIL